MRSDVPAATSMPVNTGASTVPLSCAAPRNGPSGGTVAPNSAMTSANSGACACNDRPKRAEVARFVDAAVHAQARRTELDLRGLRGMQCSRSLPRGCRSCRVASTLLPLNVARALRSIERGAGAAVMRAESSCTDVAVPALAVAIGERQRLQCDLFDLDGLGPCRLARVGRTHHPVADTIGVGLDENTRIGHRDVPDPQPARQQRQRVELGGRPPDLRHPGLRTPTGVAEAQLRQRPASAAAKASLRPRRS